MSWREIQDWSSWIKKRLIHLFLGLSDRPVPSAYVNLNHYRELDHYTFTRLHRFQWGVMWFREYCPLKVGDFAYCKRPDGTEYVFLLEEVEVQEDGIKFFRARKI